MLEIKSWVVPNQRKLLSPYEVLYHNMQANLTCDILGGVRLHDVYSIDGLKLDVLFFSGIHQITKQPVEKSQKTVVIFVGRGTYHYTFTHLSESYRKKGCNVVLLQYRGVGESEGELTSQEDIIKDGQAVIDYIEWYHNVPRFLIAIHGYSMGGGFGTAVAKSRPGVSMASERSFSSLQAATVYVGGSKIGDYLQNMIGSFGFSFSPGFASTAIHVAGNFGQANGWNLNPSEDWLGIVGRKCVVYHPSDNIIPKGAQLVDSIKGRVLDTTFIEITGGSDHPKNTHGRPLTTEEFEQVYKSLYPYEVEVPAQTSLELLWKKFCLLRENYPSSLGVLFFQEILTLYPSKVSEEVLWQLLFLVKAKRAQNGCLIGIESYTPQNLQPADMVSLFKVLHMYFNRPHARDDIISGKYLELHDYFLWLCRANPLRASEIISSLENSFSPECNALAAEMKIFFPL